MAEDRSEQAPALRHSPDLGEHPLRRNLAEEIHARPYQQFTAPAQVSLMAFVSGEPGATADREHVTRLCREFGAAEPEPGARHHSVELNPVRLKWERHSEFSTYHLGQSAAFDEPFAKPPLDFLPKNWVEAVPGALVAATHVTVEPSETPARSTEALTALFAGHTYTASHVLGGKAQVWTDFRIHGDGFGRILIRDKGLNTRQTGRLIQRLTELETYRMLAMLAFPEALAARPRITAAEQRLGVLVEQLDNIGGIEDEQRLLNELTRLAAQIEALFANMNYRLSATRAYYELVKQRAEELREERIEGLQPPAEFLFRRLAPAMATCDNTALRKSELARRIAHATELLRTRINVALEKQNQTLLTSMDRRARTQLRLQETVEGLSVVAISYYLLGVLSYALKAAKAAGWPVNPDLGVGFAIPLVAAMVWFAVRRIRRTLGGASHRKENRTRSGT